MLYDGSLCGTWWIDGDRSTGGAALVIRHPERLSRRATAALAAEGHRLMRFLDADGARDVRLVAIA